MVVKILIVGGPIPTSTESLLRQLCLECGDTIDIVNATNATTDDFDNGREYDIVHLDECYKESPSVLKKQSWQSMNRGMSKKQRRTL